MDLFDLEIFVTVANQKSISNAAKFLHFSQSSASTRITNLEKELGFSLFTRNQLGVKLTEKGSLFYFYANRMLTNMNTCLESLSGKHVDTDMIRFGISQSFLTILLPILSNWLKQGEKEMNWQLNTGFSFEMIFRVHAGELDFAFVNDVQLGLEGLNRRYVGDEPVHLVGSSAFSRFTYKSLITFFEKTRFVLPKPGTPMREMLELEVFIPLGARPKHFIEADNSELIKPLIKQGVGIGFLPFSTIRELQRQDPGALILLDTPNLHLKRKCYCVISNHLPNFYLQKIEEIVHDMERSLAVLNKSEIQHDVILL